MRENHKQLLILFLTSIFIFVIKAFFYIPLCYDRGITGHGLYEFLSEIQFMQVILLTFFVILITAIAILKLRYLISFIIAFAFSSINLGLLLIDARIHTYLPNIENLIQKLYGTRFQIYTRAFLALFIGITLVVLVFRRNKPLTRY